MVWLVRLAEQRAGERRDGALIGEPQTASPASDNPTRRPCTTSACHLARVARLRILEARRRASRSCVAPDCGLSRAPPRLPPAQGKYVVFFFYPLDFT